RVTLSTAYPNVVVLTPACVTRRLYLPTPPGARGLNSPGARVASTTAGSGGGRLSSWIPGWASPGPLPVLLNESVGFAERANAGARIAPPSARATAAGQYRDATGFRARATARFGKRRGMGPLIAVVGEGARTGLESPHGDPDEPTS